MCNSSPPEGDFERSVCEFCALKQRQRRSYNGVMCWGSVYRVVQPT